ncbi:hypothetical protein KDA_37830 [Dictyobacter alpinus]|uniref:DUF2252 domain-containing protein n=1 Tax=Dictyobacter alpinus TaxID=2014873 RepID=A0A402BAF2_9CHLR|nr:DUF2252 domain-containing protein [Dictyobacter alpinus]GCE28299.1 hypothetical protein KDA_37830 [Dictyobacter alpinus]
MSVVFKAKDAPSLEERLAEGKALRQRVPRTSHAEWKPAPERPDPVVVLEQSNSSRLESLIPIQYSRMLLSPFAFLRGSALIMALDLSTTPYTGIQVQLCGDAHLSNFGTYATPERRQVFDVNDFDETLPGPWEWDIKRLATSVVVAGQSLGLSEEIVRHATLQSIQAYREHLWTYAFMHPLDMWYTQIRVEQTLKRMHPRAQTYMGKELSKARQRTSTQIFPKLTEEIRGHYCIKDEPPYTMRQTGKKVIHQLDEIMQNYTTSLADDRKILLSRYRLVDYALKVVGVGSVGTRCYIALLLGVDDTDPLFLQIKEAQASVLEPYLESSRYNNHAQRVVAGQQLIQGSSDIFLGWASSEARTFYVRQLRDMSSSPRIEHMQKGDFITYVGLCGWALARAHARSGDPAHICGYLGKNDVFDNAVTDFAFLYAKQVDSDHTALTKAAKAGRIPVEQNEDAIAEASAT